MSRTLTLYKEDFTDQSWEEVMKDIGIAPNDNEGYPLTKIEITLPDNVEYRAW